MASYSFQHYFLEVINIEINFYIKGYLLKAKNQVRRCILCCESNIADKKGKVYNSIHNVWDCINRINYRVNGFSINHFPRHNKDKRRIDQSIVFYEQKLVRWVP